MTDATIVLVVALAIGLGLTGVMYLGWTMVESAKALRRASEDVLAMPQRQQQLSDAALKVLADGMTALTKELETAHEISGLITEQMVKMWKRREEVAGVNVRSYTKPFPSNGDMGAGDEELSPLSPAWRSPRMEEEIRNLERSKEQEQWGDG